MIQRLLSIAWTLVLAAFASIAICLASAVASADTTTLSRTEVNELKIARQALKDDRTAVTTQLMLNALKIKVYQDWFNNKQPSVITDRALPSAEAILVGGTSTYAISGLEMKLITELAGKTAPYLIKFVKGSPVIAASVAAYYVSKDFLDYKKAVSSLDDVKPADRLNQYRKLLEYRDSALDIIRNESLEINKLDTQLRIYDVADKN